MKTCELCGQPTTNMVRGWDGPWHLLCPLCADEMIECLEENGPVDMLSTGTMLAVSEKDVAGMLNDMRYL